MKLYVHLSQYNVYWFVSISHSKCIFLSNCKQNLAFYSLCKSCLWTRVWLCYKTLYGLLFGRIVGTTLVCWRMIATTKNKLCCTFSPLSRSSQETKLKDAVFWPFTHTHIYVHKQKENIKFQETMFYSLLLRLRLVTSRWMETMNKMKNKILFEE